MEPSGLDFPKWLEQADIPAGRQTAEVRALLQAVFRFRRQQGSDYFSTRLLSHFLLHCDCGLKVAQIARLLGLGRQATSRHQGFSSKQAIQQAHHRLNGRAKGKLLPRYAGPIAQFLLQQPQATRRQLLDFLHRTFGVSVSRIALYKFLKKFGLDQLQQPPAADAAAAAPSTRPDDQTEPASTACLPHEPPAQTPASPPAQTPAPAASAALPSPILLASATLLPAGPAPPFCTVAPSTPAPSC